MSRPMISAGSQQSRSGYPPPGGAQHLRQQRQDDTTITMRTHQPDSASAQDQGAWRDTRSAGEAADAQDVWEAYDEADRQGGAEDEQQAWNSAVGAASAIEVN